MAQPVGQPGVSSAASMPRLPSADCRASSQSSRGVARGALPVANKAIALKATGSVESGVPA